KLKGAERVIAIDNIEHRLNHAKKFNGAEVYNFSKEDNIGKLLHESTRGGADVVIDCVGMDGQIAQDDLEISSNSAQRGNISQIITAAESVRKFGTIQLTCIYGTPADNFPIDLIFNRDVQVKSGQAPVIHQMPELYEMIKNEDFDALVIIPTSLHLQHDRHADDIFAQKKTNNIKV